MTVLVYDMSMKYLNMVLKGIFAGASIALGGFLFILVTSINSSEIFKVLGALIFPFGLFLVCFFKFNLFTGKIGLIFEKRQEKDFYISLPLMYLGNLIGSLIIGYLCYFIFRNTDIFNRVTAINEAKTTLDSFDAYVVMIVKSLITGLCVYLAVKSYNVCSKMYQKIILVFIFIAIFVYIGGDHCVANMFYFSFGNNWGLHSIINILIVTICNSLGTIPGVLLFKNLLLK